jgi:hypothetical protein
VEAIDVEAAFLEGEMNHELYIDLPYMYKESVPNEVSSRERTTFFA